MGVNIMTETDECVAEENRLVKRVFSRVGFWWFVETSYSYVAPRGLVEHVKFFRDLPGAYLRFRRVMHG